MAVTINGTTGIAGVDGSASTPAVQGTDTNTGIYFGSDTISFTEGGTQVGEFDSSANFKFNSGYGSAAVAYGCRAWVNFNGTSTVAIRASGNVSSITDGGTGVYTINFTTAISDGNYDFNASCYSGSGGEGDVVWTSSSGTLGTTGLAIVCGVPGTAGSTGYTVRDNAVICVSIFR
jgi:hypothetical protein